MMLEVRNLKKVYKIKNANPVPALDDVSLKFPDTGLVFILGKSGSGKSILLNVMGGLDLADSGEIVINGKSSKDFDASEMDSYRNTYLGFIFQEYNILSDFTVRENIALALELQHKKPTDEMINGILEEVDLVGYGRRKPNELSGGQKQRVAIARALVKEPKILFGDEPTGALDSATGLAVFETLKKLSKTRLVVVVSHDRDFAERFGDRVIELKDGKVISDITKIYEDTDETDTGVSLYGSNLIKFEKGHKLTKEDIDLINKKLETTEEDAFFSIDPRVNDSVSYAAMINENGQKESFIETDNEEVEQKKEKWRVVKSKFPMSAAFRMGAKSLGVKPFRLFMTILLSFIAFAMFGLAVTFARVNKVSATVNSLEKSNEQVLVFGKSGMGNTNFGEEFKKNLEAKTGAEFDVVGSFRYNVSTAKTDINSRYYANYFNGCIVLDDAKSKTYNVELAQGRLPTAIDEVAITKDMYNTYKAYGIRDANRYDKYLDADKVTEDKIMGYTIGGYNSELSLKIVGIVDTKLDMTGFDALKEASNNNYSNDIYTLESELRSLRQSGLHTLAFVSQPYFEKYVAGKSSYYSFTDEWNTMWLGVEYEETGSTRTSSAIMYTDEAPKAFFDPTKTTLASNEVLIDLDSMSNYYRYILGYSYDSTIYDVQTWTFNNVYNEFIAGDAAPSGAYQVTDSWSSINNSLQMDYGTCYDVAKHIYAQNNYKGQNNGYQDPYVANEVYYQYYNVFYDDSLTKQIFKTDTMDDFIKEEYDGANYYVIDWDKVQTFYDSDGTDSKNIYLNIYYSLYNNSYKVSEEYNPERAALVNAELERARASAEEVVKEVVINTKPQAAQMAELERLWGDNYEKYADEHYVEIYNAYKDDAGMITAFLNGRTLDLDNPSNQREFARWYLQGCINKNDYSSAITDKTWYNNYLLYRIDKFVKAVQDGDVTISSLDLTLIGKVANNTGDPTVTNYYKKIVGVFVKERSESYEWLNIYMNRSDIEAIAGKFMDLNYSVLITPMPKGQVLTKAVSVYYDSYDAYEKVDWKNRTKDDFYYSLQSPLVQSIMVWVSLLAELEQIFLYVGIAMAAFSMLLFYNFMSISINNKRHEIGILRAVGARGLDVFKIFYSESAIIATINFVLAVISLIAVGIVINQKIGEAIQGLVLLKVGIVEILLVFAVALFASFISSILPVTKIARQKPIDAIREK